MTSLADIDSQPASSLVCSHMICINCSIVDREWGRMKHGHLCEACGFAGEGGRLHFPISIHILVDLIQQSYHSQSPVGRLAGPNGQDVGTVLYFCTLREALLNHFIIETLKSQKIPKLIIEKLLDDNKMAGQKFGGLFSSIVGERWSEAVNRMSSNEIKFETTSDLMRRASELRNKFLHEGSAWEITRQFSTDCINAIPNMVELFVALHNEFTRSALCKDA